MNDLNNRSTAAMIIKLCWRGKKGAAVDTVVSRSDLLFEVFVVAERWRSHLQADHFVELGWMGS